MIYETDYSVVHRAAIRPWHFAMAKVKGYTFTNLAKVMLAKAVYTNKAETADELSFKPGDVLNVIEKDPNGLEGWWLCSLRGKTGIAPGNRLKEVNNVFDKPKGDAAKVNRSQDGVITPKKMGDSFVYDTPMSLDLQNRNMEQDYDQPRSGLHPVAHLDPKQVQLIAHMQDKLNLEHIRAIESLYDSPGNKLLPPHMYNVPFPDSNRSSSVSMSSVLSSISGTPSSSGSAPPSERSSIDVTHDLYDIPSSTKNGRRFLKVQKSKSSSDMLEALDTYDSPAKDLKSVLSSLGDMEPMYHTPGPLKAIYPEDAGDYCEIHDAKPPTPAKMLAPKLHHQKQIEEDMPSYDNPKCRPFQSYSDYDVPPQVSRDTSNNPSDICSLLHNIIQTMSVPDLSHKELRLAVGPAITTVNKHQQDLHRSSSKLGEFVTKGWRKKDNLEPKLFDLKISCIAVKTALTEFVDFGNGALANSTGLPDKSIYFALKSFLEPLSARLDKISTCMNGLEAIKWDITKLSMETLESCAVDDDLNQLMNVGKDLSVLGGHLTAFIHSKAAPLFEQYQLTSTAAASPTSGSKPDLSQNEATPPKTTDKPTVKPKPPTLKPKPKVDSVPNDDSLKSPPVMPKPAGLRNVPVGVIKSKSADNTLAGEPTEDYDVPTSRFITPHKVTATKLASFDDGNKDYDNAETRYSLSQLEGYNDPPEEPLDYDYAALTPDLHKTSLQYKYEQDSIDAVVQSSAVHPSPPVRDSPLHRPTANSHPSLNMSSVSAAYDSPSLNMSSASAAYDSPASRAASGLSEDYDTPTSRARQLVHSSARDSYDTPLNRSREDLYDAPSNNNHQDLYDSPSGRLSNAPLAASKSDSRLSSELDMSGQVNHLNVPSIRTSGLSPKFKAKLEKLRTDAEIPVLQQRDSQASVSSDLGTRPNSDVTPRTSMLVKSVISDSDQQVLGFYANQIDGHMTVLTEAMTALFQAVDYNQTPKVFIAHSKFVVLAAHKLVYIGDTICRNISAERVRGDIMSWSNQLCDALKATVTSTKQAALQHPNIQATQEMVNRVVNVSQITNNLRQSIIRNV